MARAGNPARPAPPQPAGRCLIVTSVFPPVHGGSASVYDSLARFAGGRVCVLAPSHDYTTGLPIAGAAAFDAAAPFTVYRIRLLRTQMRDGRSSARRRLMLAAEEMAMRARVMRAIAAIARTEGIGSVCIGELAAGGWLAASCRRMFGVRVVIYVHGEEISTRNGYDQRGWRRRRALSQADTVVAVSRFTQAALTDLMGMDPARIALIPNGVDLVRFMPRPSRPDLLARYGLEGRRVLLTVGRPCARKGMDRVIEALPALLRAMPDLIYLVVGDSAWRPVLERQARQTGVAQAVVFAGSVPACDLADHYALAQVFIMANRALPDGDTEGFGLVFLEANACCVPVIAGQAGGSTDAVTDGVNGICVDGDDRQAVADAILRLFGDADLRIRLRETGLRVAARAGWPDRVARFLAVCDGGPPAFPEAQVAAQAEAQAAE